MSVSIEKKMNRNVVRIHSDKTITYAGRILKAVDIGCLIVVDGSDKISGILTERDIVRKVIAAGRDPDTTRVGDVMSRDVITLDKGKTVSDAVRLMEARKIKKLPVTDGGGRLVGILTSTDLLDCSAA